MMMLRGMAVETMCKALILASSPDDFKAFLNQNSGHHITELCIQSGLDLDDDMKNFLDRLAAFVIWGGRYPVPLRVDRRATQVNGHVDFKCHLKDGDGVLADQVYRDLRNLLAESYRQAEGPRAGKTDVRS